MRKIFYILFLSIFFTLVMWLWGADTAIMGGIGAVLVVLADLKGDLNA